MQGVAAERSAFSSCSAPSRSASRSRFMSGSQIDQMPAITARSISSASIPKLSKPESR